MTIIAAMSLNRAIGFQNRLPWMRISDDFKWFKEKTIHNTIVMGRKTFESIGKPLPERKTLIITRQFSANENEMSWDKFIKNHSMDENLFICGGAAIYRLALDQSDDMFLTRIHDEFEGDTFMPNFEHYFNLKEIIKEDIDYKSEIKYSIEHWIKK